MKTSTTLRHLMKEKAPIIAPGAYDGLSAKLVERAGFSSSVYASGGGDFPVALEFRIWASMSMAEIVIALGNHGRRGLYPANSRCRYWLLAIR